MKLFLSQILFLTAKAQEASHSSDYYPFDAQSRTLTDFTDIFPDEVNCTLSNGNILNAADWVCRTLDRSIERDPPEIPEPIAEYACDPLPPLENGEIFCYDSWKIGTVCMGVCKNGWVLEPNKKKRCFAKKKWDKTKPGQSPVKWNFAKSQFECVRDYLESPCLTNNGGCSHECIDKGDMLPICVCPCGHTLADDGKTCIDNQECPFDISLWLDGTISACASEGYHDAQKATMANIADFFNVEVNTYDARIFAASYGNGRVQHEVSDWNFTSVPDIIDDLDVLTNECADNIISNVFLEPNDRAHDAATVSFVSMAAELLDSTEMITFNRPETDITIVMMEGDDATEQAKIQASILACNHETYDVCTNIINLNEGMSAGDIETRVNREPCYKRNYASTIACGEFSMELDIPICSLRGLQQEDMIFNAGKDGACAPTMENNGTHYKWIIGYGDCGTTQVVDEDLGTVTFTNRMLTWINQEAPVFPVVPEFDVELECVVSTKFEFVFHGDFYPELTAFRGLINIAGTQTGDLQIFANSDFTETWDGKVMDTGVDVFVQSNATLVSSGQKLQVTDCVASPGEIVDLASPSGQAIWPMIVAGCLLDETVQILARGPNNEVRFLFESFRFHGELSGAQINLQCRYKVCEAAECPSLVTCANPARKRKRRAAAPSRFHIAPLSNLA